jgi:alkyl sulfatase BDS1-like metallo-beta-lactamase superfamily hydrolase
MMNKRSFLSRTAGTAVAVSAIHGVERAAAAEPSSRLPALAADRSYAVPPSVHADLKRHGTIFERKIHQVGSHVYSAVGFADGNSVMVVGEDGVIIVDTGPDLAAAREVAAEFRKITDKPVRAVIYTFTSTTSTASRPSRRPRMSQPAG